MAKELSMVFKCGKVGKCDRKHQCKNTEKCDGHENPTQYGLCLDAPVEEKCIECNRFFYICPDLIMESE